MQKLEEVTLQDARNTSMDIEATERLDEIQATWQNGSDNLVSLKSGLGGTVAKMERAQKAVGVLEGS